jgi:DNA-binding MarR family transcriptional regulator
MQLMANQKSVFDIIKQNNTTDDRIVAALERISEAFRVLLWQQSKETGLSPIQIQILIFILHHTVSQCKVSYLAGEFNMTKATISDAVKVLAQKKIITKRTEETDSRSYTIQLTAKGRELANKSSLFANSLLKPVDNLRVEQKENLLFSLTNLIYQLNQAGIIQLQRMCYTCRFLGEKNNKHYCNLMKMPLKETDIRIDCPEHEIAGEK